MTTTPEGFVKASEPYHMSIKDVLNIPIGKPTRIFFLDRNMFDISCDNNPIGKAIKPSEFFREGYYIDFTRHKGLLGTWKWTFDNHHVDVNREFDLDMGNCWFPMKNERVPKKYDQGFFLIPKVLAEKSYTELSQETKIGWRGPMMLASDMDKCPDIKLRKSGYAD